MLIAKSTNGYFFGAWSDVTYENRNMWGYSRYNWLWRYALIACCCSLSQSMSPRSKHQYEGNISCIFVKLTVSCCSLYFSFNPGTTTLQQATIPSNWGNAVYDYSTYGPTYGGGHDLYFNTGLSGSSSGQSTYVPGVSGGGSSSSGLTAGCSGGGGGSSWSFSNTALG